MVDESNFIKHLTESDVNGKLAVTSKMARVMPAAKPGSDTAIRVLDGKGDKYQFYLAGRRGEYRKPIFKRKDWRAFIKKRGAKAGNSLYFWREVNESKRTEYRIEVISSRNGDYPHPEGLGSSNPPSEFGEDLRTWAAHCLVLGSSIPPIESREDLSTWAAHGLAL